MGGWGAMSLKTLAAYSVLMLTKSWKTASDFHVPAPKIPKTRNYSQIGADFRKISPGQKLVVKALGQHPNRSPIFGWRAQNPKSAVWISDFGFYNFCQGVGGYQCQNCIKLIHEMFDIVTSCDGHFLRWMRRRAIFSFNSMSPHMFRRPDRPLVISLVGISLNLKMDERWGEKAGIREW